jgi:hypothetical protein
MLALFLSAALSATGGGNTNVLLSPRAGGDHEPSAEANSEFWKACPRAVIETTILGAPVTNLTAEIRSRWTPENLYLLFIGRYESLHLKPDPDTTSETYRLWLHDCFEAYLAAESEPTNRYREFQMSPQGEFLDLDIDSSKPRPGYNGEQQWSSGMKVCARVDATNQTWCGEMRIPFAAIVSQPLGAGAQLRANFCRQDGTGRNRTFLAWQPTGVWSPHRPEKFGKLKLVADQNDAVPASGLTR